MTDDDPKPNFKNGRGNPSWKPGVSGNPAGRPKGCRNKFTENFISAIYNDFQANGEAVIARVREEKPDQYLKVCVALVPKELKVTSEADDLTDDQLRERIKQLRTALAPILADAGILDAPGSAEEAAGSEQAGKVSALH